MNIKKYAPWNWFQHEKDDAQTVPVYTGLTRAMPSYPISQLHREIDRLFDEAFRGFPSMFREGLEWPEITPVMLSPNLDIKESDKDYVISVEVPGISKDDVDIRVEGNTLIITGEKKQEKKEDKENYHCVERHYGSFERMLTLPQDASADNINASFKDGVLRIDIKRQAKGVPTEVKKIDVKAA